MRQLNKVNVISLVCVCAGAAAAAAASCIKNPFNGASALCNSAGTRGQIKDLICCRATVRSVWPYSPRGGGGGGGVVSELREPFEPNRGSYLK